MQQNVFSNTSQKKKPQQVNPLAQALAETEQRAFNGAPNNNTGERNPFADALARTGGQMPDASPESLKAQEEAREKQKKEQLRRKLHKEINPIDAQELYSAREKQVKEEIDKLRHELKMLALDVAKFEKQIDLTLMSEVVDPGQDGKYYITFFQKLRAFIMLLRQKIKSASTWATQMNTKKKKKRGKGAKGIEVSGAGYEKTDMVQKMMHHENSTLYSGS